MAWIDYESLQRSCNGDQELYEKLRSVALVHEEERKTPLMRIMEKFDRSFSGEYFYEDGDGRSAIEKILREEFPQLDQ